MLQTGTRCGLVCVCVCVHMSMFIFLESKKDVMSCFLDHVASDK